MKIIDGKFPEFFADLEKNNNKEWFHANKKRYEQVVKHPFASLIQALIAPIQTIDPAISDTTKEIVMRINRDVRFSKDKTLYNTMMKANFTPEGRKSGNPGFYLGISANDVHMGGGLYQVSPADLKKIRGFMVSNIEMCKQVFESKRIKEVFGKVKGEKAKRIDKDLALHVEELPIIQNKQFFYMKKIAIADFLKADQVQLIIEHFETASEAHGFLMKALH
ncbi:MAG: DUF2461 domain-containing protein [Cyclobacteriaceae bacterium]